MDRKELEKFVGKYVEIIPSEDICKRLDDDGKLHGFFILNRNEDLWWVYCWDRIVDEDSCEITESELEDYLDWECGSREFSDLVDIKEIKPPNPISDYVTIREHYGHELKNWMSNPIK